ncbi:hypothetical protein [Salipiger abyssi]|uniref:hypothetical protein n=1 Tax=Salipiger abyssi TaxID=1250539 RepID=UPI001A8FCFB7|nr:hypothetical protein [Salipiger abyssi]MBN9886612.1 hypothetical protein [Salipiger abyssi]
MKTFICAALLAVSAAPAFAVDARTAMEAFLQSGIQPWAQDPALIAAIEAQNAQTAGYDAARIDALDSAWQAEIGAADTPTISAVVESDLATFLRDHVGAAQGAITEIFVMDAQGLNVAASAITSDYWQGDEAKFTETYGQGAGAVHYGEVEFDESSQSYQAQISLTLSDPETGAPIGAMTVGVNADLLM